MGESFDIVKMMKKNKAYLTMIIVQLAYAGMALFSKTAIAKGMNPFVFVVYRQAFATLALLPFALFLERLIRIYICHSKFLNSFFFYVMQKLILTIFSGKEMINCHTGYCGRSFWFLYLGKVITQHFGL